MSEDDTTPAADPEEVEPIEDDKSIRREITEIRPTDPSPEVFGEEPPNFSLGGVLGIIKKKGLAGAHADDAWGPHVHLFIIMIIIFLIALGVAIVQFTTT